MSPVAACRERRRVSARGIAALLAAAYVIALAAPVPARADSRGRAEARIVAQAPAPRDGSTARWRAFQSTPGRFKVAFPGAPTVTRRKIRTEIGEVASIAHTAGDGMHATYDVTYNDYPKAGIARLSTQKLLNAARDGLVYQAQGRLIAEKPVTMGKIPGRDHEIVGADGMRYLVRMLVVDNRLYQLTAMARPPAQPDERAFFDSFQLVDAR